MKKGLVLWGALLLMPMLASAVEPTEKECARLVDDVLQALQMTSDMAGQSQRLGSLSGADIEQLRAVQGQCKTLQQLKGILMKGKGEH